MQGVQEEEKLSMRGVYELLGAAVAWAVVAIAVAAAVELF